MSAYCVSKQTFFALNCNGQGKFRTPNLLVELCLRQCDQKIE